jgi:restriction endonuclease Mrr
VTYLAVDLIQKRLRNTYGEGILQHYRVDGDRGVDGVIRFPIDNKSMGRALVSVKGGRQLAPAMVRDLIGTVDTQRAEMGLLITMSAVTKGITEAINRSGSYIWPINQRRYPKVQAITVEKLLSGHKPELPPAVLPYVKARAYAGEQLFAGDLSPPVARPASDQAAGGVTLAQRAGCP